MAERPASLRLDAQYAMLDTMLADLMLMISQLGPTVNNELLDRINTILEDISDQMDVFLANEPRS